MDCLNRLEPRQSEVQQEVALQAPALDHMMDS